ncbi:Uncharacterised protein [Lelliottia amnigena]|nr:Uncharacterised protein [Lelliottia amnigena]
MAHSRAWQKRITCCYCCESPARSCHNALPLPDRCRFDAPGYRPGNPAPAHFPASQTARALSLFQHIQHALAGFNFFWRSFGGVNTGAVGLFQSRVFFWCLRLCASDQSRCKHRDDNTFFSISVSIPAGWGESSRRRVHQKMVKGAMTMNFTSRSSWKMLP